MERWLKEISREQFECPTKLKAVIKELNKTRQDEATPEEKPNVPNDDEAGSDPSSSTDSDDDRGEGARASGSGRPDGKPEEEAGRRKEELKQRLLQVKADENMAQQLQQQESDPQAKQMQKRESELLDLQAAAQTRRRNVAKKAVKAQASVPSESSEGSESDQEDEKAKEPEHAEKAEESKEAEKAEESKDTEMLDPVEEPGLDMSIAEVCREAYMLSDTAIDMLLEEDKKESIRSALEILENKVQQLPSGFGNRLERLRQEYETWTKDLERAVEQTDYELQTNLIKQDGAKDAREIVLTRKAEAELKRAEAAAKVLEAEKEKIEADKEIAEYDEIMKGIGEEKVRLEEGRKTIPKASSSM